MENNPERLHYAIALGLGVVGLLIILIFVSIRSQADVALGPTQSTVQITESSPTVTITGYGATSVALDSAFTLSPETNVLANSVTDVMHVYGTITDLNGCDQMVSPGNKYFRVMKSGTATGTCDFTTASPTSDNCFNINSPGASCTYTCAGGAATVGTMDCTVPVPYRTPDGTWLASIKANDGTSDAFNSKSLDINPTNALKITDSASSNVSKTAINFGAVAVGATSNEDPVYVWNIGNYNGGALKISGSGMNCTAGTEPTIDVGHIKYTDATGTAISAGTGLTGTATVFNSAFARTPAATFASAGASAASTTYFALDLTAEQGAAGTCTGTVDIVLQ